VKRGLWLVPILAGALVTGLYAGTVTNRLPARAVRLRHPVVNVKLGRFIRPSAACAVGRSRAVATAWRREGNVHPAEVTATCVFWDNHPTWVVSFQGGDVCPGIPGPRGASELGKCGGYAENVRIDGSTGAWLDTFADGHPVPPSGEAAAPLKTVRELLEG